MRIDRKTKNTLIISAIVVFGLAIAVTCAYLVYKTIVTNNTTTAYNNIASSYAADVYNDIEATGASGEKIENPIDFESLMEETTKCTLG